MIWASLSKDLKRGGIVAPMIMTIDIREVLAGDGADDNRRCFTVKSSYDSLSIVPVNHESAHNKFNLES